MPKHTPETAQKIKYLKTKIGQTVRVTVHSREHVGVVDSVRGEYLQLADLPSVPGGTGPVRSLFIGHISEILSEPLTS